MNAQHPDHAAYIPRSRGMYAPFAACDTADGDGHDVVDTAAGAGARDRGTSSSRSPASPIRLAASRVQSNAGRAGSVIDADRVRAVGHWRRGGGRMSGRRLARTRCRRKPG